MPIDSTKLLTKKGYEIYFRKQPAETPDKIPLKFSDIVEELSSLNIGSMNLYEHQFRAYDSLQKGYNIILRSGTGSGKTEAWILYFLSKTKENTNYRALVLYPTLALANDQIRRISKYVSTIKANALQLDSVKKQEIMRSSGLKGLRKSIEVANIIITNPAFLMHDIKKAVKSVSSSLLYNYLINTDLIIIDELDFYGPRSLALLLGLLWFISYISQKKIQICVLTATLSNPDDLGLYLRSLTGRDYRVIEGKPFHVENRVIIVLGKDLQKIWRRINEEIKGKENVIDDREILTAIKDYSKFKKDPYRIIAYLQAKGFDVSSITLDIPEIISTYLDDEYVTLVFTRGINSAETLVRSIKSRLGDNAPIAAHHHLIPKPRREEIEELARKGKMKIIVSPRTLTQGIDIGLIARIVHVGLPDEVREFWQREGRKGRRTDIPFTESIIIPVLRWDRELLIKGIDTLDKWLSLGIEKTLVNPENLYLHLFTGLSKLLSPWIKEPLSSLEEEALKKTGILRSDKINEKLLRWVWERLNFYEFAPPYGIKRYLVKNSEEKPLEPIGHCDLVEKFQPGCIDIGNDAIVTRLDYGRSSRHVKAVYEEPIRYSLFYKDDALSTALEEYRYIKMNWGEKPDIVKDIFTGRLSSEMLCVVYTPSNGFGKYRKIPNRCIWTLKSEKPRVLRVPSGSIVVYDRKTIYVPKNTGGEYRDFTYGFSYDVEEAEDATLLRIALAYLMIILRRIKGIAFETIMYDVVKAGEKKYFSLHEPEAAGILVGLDWREIRSIVEKYQPDELDIVLLSEIDEIAYADYITLGFDWNIIKQVCLRVIDYILSREKMKAFFKNKEITIPRPSRSLKLVAVTGIAEILDLLGELPRLVVGLSFFDGESVVVETEMYPPVPYIKPPETLRFIESRILELVSYDNFRLIVPEKNTMIKFLRTANLRMLTRVVESSSNVIELSKLLEKQGLSPSSYRTLVSESGLLKLEMSLPEIVDSLKKAEERPRSMYWREKIKKYLEEDARALYYAYLLLSSTTGS